MTSRKIISRSNRSRKRKRRRSRRPGMRRRIRKRIVNHSQVICSVSSGQKSSGR